MSLKEVDEGSTARRIKKRQEREEQKLAAEKLAKEESDKQDSGIEAVARKAAEEAARKAKEEADRKAAEEAARKAKEEADRKASEEKAEEATVITVTENTQAGANFNLERLYNAANGGLDWAYNHYHVVLLPTATYITANLVVNGLVNLKSMAELRATQWNLANKPEAPVTKVVETVEKRASVSLVKGMAGAINTDGVGASAIVRKEFIEDLAKITDIAGTSKTFLPLKNMKVGEEQKVTEIITPLTDKTWRDMLWEVALEALSNPGITLSSTFYYAVKPPNSLVAGVGVAVVAATVGYQLNKEECDNYIYDSLNNAYTAIEAIIPHWGEHN